MAFTKSFINRKGKIEFDAKHFYHFEDGTTGKIHHVLEVSVELELKDKEKFLDVFKYQHFIKTAFCLRWFDDIIKMCSTDCNCVAPDRKLYKVVLKNVNKPHFYRWESEFSENFFRGDMLLSEEKNVVRLSGAPEVINILKKIIRFFQKGFDKIRSKDIQKHILLEDFILIPNDFVMLFGNMFSKKGLVIDEWPDIYPCYLHDNTFI